MANGQNPQSAPNARSFTEGELSVLTAPRPGKPHIRMRTDGSFTVIGVNGPLDFFGPQQPLTPVAQVPAVARQFDYPTGYNTRITPRQEENISFAQLKALADGYDLLRTIIERRKDEMVAQNWTIGPKDKKAARDQRCDDLEDFFAYPDRVNGWDDWLRMLLEQVLVLDAPSIYCRPNRAGELYGLELIDGATIKRVITDQGRTPLPEEGPAYQQVLKGLPAVDYIVPTPKGKSITDDDGAPMPELIYRPRNPRVDRFYGYSPVEQIITTVNIALHRQFYQLSYYTSGSTPDLIFQVPETWNPDQIKQFQAWWNSMLEGNLGNRRGTMFVPKGVEPFDTKEKALKDEYDEWLTRICCFAFGVSPHPFIKQMNRATADTAQQQQQQEGLTPLMDWVRNMLDFIITVKFGWPDLCFRWEEAVEIDPKIQADIYGEYIDAKVYHPDEVRQKLGDDAMAPTLRAQMDMATFARTVNATVLPPDQQAEADARQADRDQVAAETAAAAKPAPGAQKAELADLLKAMPAPSVHVDAPVNVQPAAITVEAPVVNVAAPTINLPDTFVDVGATNVVVHSHAAKGRAGDKTITAERTPDGRLVGTITDGVTRHVEGKRNADGEMIVKFEE